ncbi:MAG: sulfatase [Thermoanaerobaculia bacterium]
MRRLLWLPMSFLLIAMNGSAAPRPNILVILTDDQTLESMRILEKTQRLLGEEGTTFANAFVSYPICCPSRATLLTGQYAHNHKVMANKPPDGGYGKLDHSNTLAVWLREAGYDTAHVGKYLNGYTGPEVPPGWSHWFGLSDPSTYRFYDYTVIDEGRPVHYGEAAADYQTDVLAAKAEELLRGLAPPFFLSVAPVAPHQERSDEEGKGTAPRPAPRHAGRFANEPLPSGASFDEADVQDKPPHIRKLRRLSEAKKALILRNYRGQLESLLAIDDLVERLVLALQETGQLDHTVILFTSDNGFFNGQHRIVDGKLLPYEEAIHVPLIVRGGGFPAGATALQPVSNVDLAPTIVALTGAVARRKMDGRDLLPVALDPSLGQDRALLVEGLSHNPARPSYEAVRTARWMWIEYRNGSRELYDLKADPLQLQSRHQAPGYSKVRADLARRLAGLR